MSKTRFLRILVCAFIALGTFCPQSFAAESSSDGLAASRESKEAGTPNLNRYGFIDRPDLIDAIGGPKETREPRLDRSIEKVASGMGLTAVFEKAGMVWAPQGSQFLDIGPAVLAVSLQYEDPVAAQAVAEITLDDIDPRTELFLILNSGLFGRDEDPMFGGFFLSGDPLFVEEGALILRVTSDEPPVFSAASGLTPKPAIDPWTVSIPLSRISWRARYISDPEFIQGNLGKWAAERKRAFGERQYRESEYSASSGGDIVYVDGYYRSDGTYVRPHTRRKPSKR